MAKNKSKKEQTSKPKKKEVKTEKVDKSSKASNKQKTTKHVETKKSEPAVESSAVNEKNLQSSTKKDAVMNASQYPGTQQVSNNNTIVYVLLGLLVVAAFAIGLLYGKVSTMEGQKTAAPAAPSAPGQAAPVEEVLTDDQWESITEDAEYILGEDDAPVTIVEFTDYECPFCQRYYNDTYKQIVANYVESGDVRYIMRDLPLGFHANAKPAALAARCAGDQGLFFEMHDVLFDKQSDWATGTAANNTATAEEAREGFISLAEEIGANVSTFTACYDNDTYAEEITADSNLAQSVGATGTPSFFINGTKLVGAQPYASFQAQIDEALANK